MLGRKMFAESNKHGRNVRYGGSKVPRSHERLFSPDVPNLHGSTSRRICRGRIRALIVEQWRTGKELYAHD